MLLVPFLLFYCLPVQALEKEGRLWQDETVYSILVDRFFNGDSKNDNKVNTQDLYAYNGGDFQGIIDKLDYLKELGFTTISLSSIFDNEENSYQGQKVIDYYKTEEHFGSLNTFKKLVKEAHKRDLKIMIEFVADSVSAKHAWTKDATKKNWLMENTKLNYSNPEVQKYVVDVAKWWINETNIDGYYINNVMDVPQEFWMEFSKEIKAVKTDFFIVGNTSSKQLNQTATYQKFGFDGMVNSPLISFQRDAFSKVDVNMNAALKTTEESIEIYEDSNQNATVLDDQLLPRFTRDIVDHKQNPGTRWKLALTYSYTTPGIPFIFYGSEIALDGGDVPDNNRLMGFKADKELIDYMTKLGELRQQLPALTRGTFELLFQEDGLAVYKRMYKNEVIVVVINNTSKTQNVTLSSELIENNKELRGLLAGDLVREDDRKYEIVIDREKAEIYALADKTGIKIGYISAIIAVWVVFALFIFLVMKRSNRNS